MARQRKGIGSLNGGGGRQSSPTQSLSRIRWNESMSLIGRRTPAGHTNMYDDVDDDFYDKLHTYFRGNQKKIDAWINNPNPRQSADDILKARARGQNAG